MTTEEESRLWQAEMLDSTARYDDWLNPASGKYPRVRSAVLRARDLARRARELVAESKALRSRNR